jgi:hypothetical protein
MDGGLRTTLELSATLAIASGAVWSFSKVAPSLGIIDHPGGRKAHARPIPLVGGISIFLTLLAMSAFTGIMQSASYLLVALSLVIAIGLWDDVMEISPRLKFAIQIVASGVMIFGASVGGWKRSQLRPGVDLRPSAFNEQYVAAMHHGRIALCFLRKASRDRITQRTMEIAAMGRPMLAEKTTEHDDHFIDGHEYIGFMSDSDLVEQASRLLAQPEARHALGMAARKRCLISGYSTDARAGQMVQSLAEVISRMSR